ncbi:MAG TPA: hypothetical protein VK550_15135 [Polyangiaceae bacterium]|nr:hypothetical protein [Polyangiaceae bacterium]
MKLVPALGLLGCGADEGLSPASPRDARYVLSSVVIDADGNRTTYVQTIPSLDSGPFTNEAAIELPGNGVVLAGGRHFYVGLAEEPTWVRYSVTETGAIESTGRMSFLNLGASRIDFGNAYLDDETAVSVLTNPPVAVVWNPTTMEIRGEIALEGVTRDGYELEVWTTIAHKGLVYIPARWSDWDGERIYPGVSLVIVDPKAMKIVGRASDDRCASGGRVVFDDAGYGYVMGDGRNYATQMFANASGGSAPENCLLRIAPGANQFEPGYFYTIPSLTGGRESISELETVTQDTGIAFAKMFYPDKLPPGVEPVNFEFWNHPAHKMWRLHLGSPPTAEEVQGIPFSAIGFEGGVVAGKLYTGESPDGSASDVYETDPMTNTAVLRFKMDGYFNALYELDR